MKNFLQLSPDKKETNLNDIKPHLQKEQKQSAALTTKIINKKPFLLYTTTTTLSLIEGETKLCLF